MSIQVIAALAFAALGGAASALQAPINARLAAHAGDPVAAAALSFGVGVLLLSALALLRSGLPEGSALAAAPWWAWAGGAFGAVYVWSALATVGTLGAVTMVAALILGQLSAALVIDATGGFGLAVREIDWTRIAAVGFVAMGLVLSRV
ncbi:DMT family transporter [Roseibacterium sp. SDUM158017]|uniref:DMT family transporter n=1 Tax=Roseicyclus salinarum TaxID=3036773 RepID=UPI0024150834|nr:DMT family transporter [Roseibacterium sp. SDUM158017]MDG4649892.1 DMT family transporter [Roseibacterium sp. SDUM158017]